MVSHARATVSGQMKLYFHKEASDASENYNALSLTPPEPAADTAPPTTTSVNTVTATPPTAFCQAADGATDANNERIASAASTGNRCLSTFISMPVGNAISMSTGDTNSITSQLWSSESANQAAVALNVYLYRCTTTCVSTNALTSTDRIATLTCAEPGTAATSCSVTATPANNITFAATDRIVAVVTSNVTNSRNGASTAFYFDSSARTASSVTLKYTAQAYNASNNPSLTGPLDDHFTLDSTSTCTTTGAIYNNKWICLQGSAASTTGTINAASTSGPTGDSSSWLWLRNQTTATTATTSDFGTTPSNTFLYQSMPAVYGDGNIRTAVNSSATFGIGATNPTSPFNHIGLVLWTSNTDYLELQVYSTGATTGTNSVVVALNNSGTIGTTTSLNATITTGIFGEVWLGFSNTGGTWQAQYSTDGTTWNNVGSSVSHTTAFTRVGLNAFTEIANPVSSYAGGFEWFSYGLASPTYNQTSFQWFQNLDNANPTTKLNSVAQNTATTLTSTGQHFQLRQLVKTVGLSGPSFSSTVIDSSNKGPGSIALGNDGHARITYNGTGVNFVQCTNLSCSTSNTSTIDSAGHDSSITIAGDGLPRIAYDDGGFTSGVTFVQCTNAACTTTSSTTLDSSTTALDPSVAIGSDGFGRISYSSSAGLRFVQCSNASCSTNTPTTVAAGTSTFTSLSMKASDGFPRIAYISSALKFVQCSNAACSSSTVTTVDSDTTSTEPSLAWGSDNFARITYLTNTGVKYVQCTNAACSTSTITTIDSSVSASSCSGNFPSVAMASDGTARIAYGTCSPINSVKYVTCTNASCSSNSANTLSYNYYSDSGLAIDAGDRAFVITGALGTGEGFFYQPVQFNLQFATMGASCALATYSDVTTSSTIAFYDNPTPQNGSVISSTASDPTDTGQTVVPQNYVENTSFSSSKSFGYTTDGEWDFSLFDNGATPATAYCLRIVSYDGTTETLLSNYSNYPVITTFGNSAPTTDQLLRGGEWFNSSGVKQPFFWAN